MAPLPPPYRAPHVLPLLISSPVHCLMPRNHFIVHLVVFLVKSSCFWECNSRIVKNDIFIYIFIHQYGSAQKENTNIQTKSSIKNTLTTHNVHSQSRTIFTKCIDRIFVFTNKFLPSFFNIWTSACIMERKLALWYGLSSDR